MTNRERDQLALRFFAIKAELQALAMSPLASGDLAVAEGELRAEQDEIEYRLGADFLSGFRGE